MTKTIQKNITFERENLKKAEEWSLKMFGNKRRVSDFINHLILKEKI